MVYKIEEGDLLAYLNGESNPQIETEITKSYLLQAELKALHQVDEQLRDALAGTDLFDEQDIVDVITGQATAKQRLTVAAQRRRNPELNTEMEAMKSVYTQLTAPKQSGWQLPQFIAQPIEAAMGVRSSTLKIQEHAYRVVALHAQVIIRIVPPDGEIWVLEGFITKNGLPVGQVQIDLATDDFADSDVEPLTTLQTDNQGFFVFQNLSEGTYHLRIVFEDGLILVRDLTLSDKDDEF